jgi:hypothetical protein
MSEDDDLPGYINVYIYIPYAFLSKVHKTIDVTDVSHFQEFNCCFCLQNSLSKVLDLNVFYDVFFVLMFESFLMFGAIDRLKEIE